MSTRVDPMHRLTIHGTGGGRRTGGCPCGWSARPSGDSDAVRDQFIAHLNRMGIRWSGTCDCCQAAAGAVRNGVVQLCGRCAADELERHAQEEVGAT